MAPKTSVGEWISDILAKWEERYSVKFDVLLTPGGWTPIRIARVLRESEIDFQWDLSPYDGFVAIRVAEGNRLATERLLPVCLRWAFFEDRCRGPSCC